MSDRPLRITLVSLHGLFRAKDPELGRDADTGGQIKYVLELAEELGRQEGVGSVELLTRQVEDEAVDPVYAQVEEAIGENARIVRLPFGPAKYLPKEKLWPYLDLFVDQALNHFRRNGLPDVIHGHYADAGYAGAQLARLLHIPFVFTGHSLGRVKRERLLAGKGKPEALERKYRLTQRVEAEEFALDTASMVVASTNQEVEDQYKRYDQYEPDRMEVIPPGVDLSNFRPPREGDPPVRYDAELRRFLAYPEKPFIFTMARPDERKNLRKLVEVYGQSEDLQERANLVILMGNRDDVTELEAGAQTVIRGVWDLIDKYDLYGKVAYPKKHEPADVPELYRLATARRGVFINPALTEPFGLTLLEAAGSGLPIVATNDGGPRDIIGNCRNGLLIDPLDERAIEHALLNALTTTEEWLRWSRNGVAGAHEHYTWQNHARRYLRDLKDILGEAATPVLASGGTPRKKLPEFDRLIVTDLDNTLTGDDAALSELMDVIDSNPDVGFCVATGRRLDDALAKLEEMNLPRPDVLDTSCGTELRYGADLTEDISWRKQIGHQWKPKAVRALLDGVDGLFPQAEDEQARFKISYEVDTSVAPKVSELKRLLREHKLHAKLVFSLGMYLDVLPVRGGAGLSMRHLMFRWGFPPERVLVAGDCGNDEGMLRGRTLGVVVANHSPELKKLRKHPRIYFAPGAHARGILDGIAYYDFLGHITIPNDEPE